MKPAIQCEFQLMNWGESATSGAWVKFWMNPEDLDAFRAVQCRSGKNAGQRFMGALVEIGDDEHPVAYQKDSSVRQDQTEKPKGGPLAKLAGQLCADPEFRKQMIGDVDEEEAARVMRWTCDIESRAQLDHDDVAAEIFHNEFRVPWADYCKSRA